MPKIYDLTQPMEDAALLRKKKKISLNPFHHLWTGYQHFAYWFAPPNGCVYCWTARLFVVGGAIGAGITWLLLKY